MAATRPPVVTLRARHCSAVVALPLRIADAFERSGTDPMSVALPVRAEAGARCAVNTSIPAVADALPAEACAVVVAHVRAASKITRRAGPTGVAPEEVCTKSIYKLIKIINI